MTDQMPLELRKTGHGAWIVIIDEDPPLYYSMESDALRMARHAIHFAKASRAYVARVEWTAP